MTNPFVFGYGSLVNRMTHDHLPAHPATVSGWRRVWRHTDLRPVAFLTVVPDPGTEIDGLMAGVRHADWLALDEREHAYDRVRVKAASHPLPDPPEMHLYTIPHGKHGAPDIAHPVLLSYIDVVVQGYLREFGQDGVTRFFASTSGWDAPIAHDRAQPRYPRHQHLTAEETALVDGHLEALKVRFVSPDVLTI
jgi:hypothetical protein